MCSKQTSQILSDLPQISDYLKWFSNPHIYHLTETNSVRVQQTESKIWTHHTFKKATLCLKFWWSTVSCWSPVHYFYHIKTGILKFAILCWHTSDKFDQKITLNDFDKIWAILRNWVPTMASQSLKMPSSEKWLRLSHAELNWCKSFISKSLNLTRYIWVTFWGHLKSPELSWEIPVYPHQPKRSYIWPQLFPPPNPTMTSISLWILCVPCVFSYASPGFAFATTQWSLERAARFSSPASFVISGSKLSKLLSSGVPCFCRCSGWDRQNSFELDHFIGLAAWGCLGGTLPLCCFNFPVFRAGFVQEHGSCVLHEKPCSM